MPVLILPLPLFAHTLGKSVLDVSVNDAGATVLLDFDTADLEETLKTRIDTDGSGRVEPAEFAAAERTLLAMATGGLVVRKGGERCKPEVVAPSTFADGVVRARLGYACSGTGSVAVDYPLIERMRAGHVGLLAVRLGSRIVTSNLTADQPAWEEGADSGAASVLGSAWRAAAVEVAHVVDDRVHLAAALAILAGLLLGGAILARRFR